MRERYFFSEKNSFIHILKKACGNSEGSNIEKLRTSIGKTVYYNLRNSVLEHVPTNKSELSFYQ